MTTKKTMPWDALREFALAYPTEITGQVEAFVRNLIGAGRLHEGEKLPPTAALAQQWNLPVNNVHSALAVLVKDGMLVRQPGQGTFVCRRRTALSSVAIYALSSTLANPASPLPREILSELLRQLAEASIEARVIVDPRAGPEWGSPLPALLQLVREHKVGAVIAMDAPMNRMGWLARLSRLVVFGEAKPRPWGQVAADFRQMAGMCLSTLAAQGCRSVGFMGGLSVGARRRRRSSSSSDCSEYFMDAAKDAHLSVDPDWGVPIERADNFRTLQEAGYAAFRALWWQGNPPDGLVVYPDSYLSGILLAMAELGVRAPDHIRLAFVRNERTQVFCPFPATEVVLSEQALAAALIAQARKICAGAPPERVLVPARQEDRRPDAKIHPLPPNVLRRGPVHHAKE